MSVLLQTAGGRKSFAALWTSMTSCANMGCPDVSLQVAGVSKYFITVFTGKSAKFSMYHLVSQQVWSPGKFFIAVFTDVFVWLVSVCLNHVLVQSKIVTN